MSQRLQLILALSFSSLIIGAVLLWQIALPNTPDNDLAPNATQVGESPNHKEQKVALTAPASLAEGANIHASGAATGTGTGTADLEGLDGEASAPQDAQSAQAAARRFKRTDKDKDGQIAQSEYLLSRQKAFDKLDQNGDSRLTFEEYASRSIARFSLADQDKSGALSPIEYASTAARRSNSTKTAKTDANNTALAFPQ